jgi:hypothetical protein
VKFQNEFSEFPSTSGPRREHSDLRGKNLKENGEDCIMRSFLT